MTQPASTETKVYFEGERVGIASFRCKPSSGHWAVENISGRRPLIVFPRRAVEIHQADRHSVVATPNHVMLYNSNHIYRRDLIDPRGDACELFSISPKLIEEIFQSIGAQQPVQPDRPFSFSHSPCSSEVYAAHSTFFRAIKNGEVDDKLFIEEQSLSLITRVIERAIQFYNPFARSLKRSATERRERIEAAKEFMSRNFKQPLTLAKIAEYVDYSVFHLCRVFKQRTGQSIHDFLLQLRLRSAIECVLDEKSSLTDIALDHSFSSHSHFTNSFRRRFRIAPNALRTHSCANSYRRLASYMSTS